MKRRPDLLTGKTIRVSTNCGGFYLTINTHKGEIFEVRMELGKSGNCVRGFLHLISIFLSNQIQNTEEIKDVRNFILRHLKGFSCGNPFHKEGVNYLSCIDWVGQTLLEEIDKPKEKDERPDKS